MPQVQPYKLKEKKKKKKSFGGAERCAVFSKTKMANLRGGGESGVLGGEGIGQNQGAGTSTLWTGDDKHTGLTATKFSAV